jgi:hypothetical protein
MFDPQLPPTDERLRLRQPPQLDIATARQDLGLEPCL